MSDVFMQSDIKHVVSSVKSRRKKSSGIKETTQRWQQRKGAELTSPAVVNQVQWSPVLTLTKIISNTWL